MLMSSTAIDITQIYPTITLTESEYVELNNIKVLLAALGIKNIDTISIGQIIRIRRALEGLTTTELAEKTGLDRGHLAKVENDKTEIRESTITKIELVFGATFSQVLMQKIKLKY